MVEVVLLLKSGIWAALCAVFGAVICAVVVGFLPHTHPMYEVLVRLLAKSGLGKEDKNA
ncbi:MAG: hypothetical protein JSR59_21505 [Proteobacteria bacterium]|nr:hypothetical protein [Pseudomonadota bacterium]